MSPMAGHVIYATALLSTCPVDARLAAGMIGRIVEGGVTYDIDVIYAGHVIYVEDDISGESRHLCAASHRRDTSSMTKHVIYGQNRHLWTARRLRGKPIPGSARVYPLAVVSTA